MRGSGGGGWRGRGGGGGRRCDCGCVGRRDTGAMHYTCYGGAWRWEDHRLVGGIGRAFISAKGRTGGCVLWCIGEGRGGREGDVVSLPHLLIKV